MANMANMANMASIINYSHSKINTHKLNNLVQDNSPEDLHAVYCVDCCLIQSRDFLKWQAGTIIRMNTHVGRAQRIQSSL